MNRSVNEAVSLASDIKIDLAECTGADIALCPPFTALKAVSDVVNDTQIKVGAQNMHWEKDGAFTGETSASMLRGLYCRYVILGHSERRAYFHETNDTVNKKVKAALAASLHPIVCVGETLKEREADKCEDVVRKHVEKGLAGISEDMQNIVVAYEPVWAIGTGLTASPEQAQEVHAFIRGILTEMFDESTANSIRIQYGGSVKPANAKELFAQPDIDGGLIGGASLDARSFIDIVQAAMEQ